MSMSAIEFILLAVLAVTVWYWLDGIAARDLASAAGRHACEDVGVQFLDDSVVLQRLALRRNGGGRLQLCRDYRFEFSSDGSCRYQGEIVLAGKQVTQVAMEPYRINDA